MVFFFFFFFLNKGEEITRAKEVKPESRQMPNYKSPATRLVHSLRKGYDNLRGKLQALRNKIKYYQIRERDLENSRACYKEKVVSLKEQVRQLNEENEKLKKQAKKKQPI